MKKQEFLAAIRREGEKFRADKIVIETGKQQLAGNGVVRIADSRFVIEVTLNDASNVPGLPEGIHGQNDFWKISGIIENEIPFRVCGLPNRRSGSIGENSYVTFELSTYRMELEPSGVDLMTYQEISETLGNLKNDSSSKSVHVPHADTATPTDASAGGGTPTVPSAAGDVDVSFDAVLPNFKCIAANSGTHTVETNSFLGESSRNSRDTFQGDVPEWRFGLVQRERDLHVHLRSKTGYRSADEAHDQRLFQAFLAALAFIHGQHAWPFSVEHRRDGKLVQDRVQLHRAVARTPHAPFSEWIAFNAAVGTASWDFQAVVQTVYAFFSANSKLSRETTQLLYLCRESGGSNVPYRIKLLSLCSLLESLVQAIYAEMIEPQTLSETATFDAAKQEVCNELEQKARELRAPAAYQRLLAILKQVESTSLRMKFQAVIEHLGLKPEDEWQRLFQLWTGCRNPLSHRMAANDGSEASMKQDMAAQSDIAGAINCMVLKLMGYSGIVQRSAFEDKHQTI